MHMLFETEELLTSIGLQLAPRLHLWRSDLHSLGTLAQTSACAASALRPLLRQLKAKNQARLLRLAHCVALLMALPIPLSCQQWVTEYVHNLPSAQNATRAYITYNGRIVLLENTCVEGFVATIRVVRTTITPASGSAGTMTTCAFTRVFEPNNASVQIHRYMGKRLQTQAFASTEELTYQLHMLTRVGAELWPARFTTELRRVLLGSNNYRLPHPDETDTHPQSTHPASARGTRLFFLRRRSHASVRKLFLTYG
jgi:hypothetical protein